MIETMSRSHPTIERYLDQQARGTSGHIYVILIGLRTFDTEGLLQRILEGFSYHTCERLRKMWALSPAELGEMTQIPTRTLARRKAEGRLHADESDRLLRLARIFAKVLDLFEGDAVVSRQWLDTPQLALGNKKPKEYMKTEVGAREIEAVIGRLEHGIPV